MTPLLAAATASNARTVRLLLAAGADVRTADDTGRTPLMYAAATGHLATTELLISAGARADRESSDGYTALELAAVYGRDEIVAPLSGDRVARQEVLAGVLEGAESDDPPKLKKQTRPVYTDDGLHRKIQGALLLRVAILTSGRIGAVRIITSLDVGLDLNAIDCVREWEFTPAHRDGKPVDVVGEIEVEYSILWAYRLDASFGASTARTLCRRSWTLANTSRRWAAVSSSERERIPVLCSSSSRTRTDGSRDRSLSKISIVK